MRIISVKEYGDGASSVYVNGTWTGLTFASDAVKEMEAMFADDLIHEMYLMCMEHGLTDEEAKVAISLLREDV